MSKIYTITHETSGAIRINQPSGGVLTFANAAWLAEAHANAIAHVQELSEVLRDVRDVANDAKIRVEHVRESVLKALNQDVPF